MGTAPQRSASRRWTVRTLVVAALAVPALIAGIATANAAELPGTPDLHGPEAPHVVDTKMADETLAEHGLTVDEQKLFAVPGAETESAGKAKPTEKSKKADKD